MSLYSFAAETVARAPRALRFQADGGVAPVGSVAVAAAAGQPAAPLLVTVEVSYGSDR